METKRGNIMDKEIKINAFAAMGLESVRSAGYSASALRSAGYSASEVLSAGYSASELWSAEYSASALRSAGYSASALRSAGYSEKDLEEWESIPTLEKPYTRLWNDIKDKKRCHDQKSFGPDSDPKTNQGHTPGPWVMAVEYLGKTTPPQWSAETADHKRVLAISTNEADIRLIAAAPELLEAAKRALTAVQYLADKSSDYESDAIALEAAIAKATGKRNTV